MAHFRTRVGSRVGLALGAAALAVLHTAPPSAAAPDSHDDLVKLFAKWREFQPPRMRNGVPDYTVSAMSAQQRELEHYRRRLADIDASRWPPAQQVDWEIVQAEMNGLDFDHVVLRPWANNPAFYVTVFPSQSDQPAREGPHAAGAVELWTYTFPLTAERAAQLAAGLRPIPSLLEQARRNLTGEGRDLWTYGARSVREQARTLADLAGQVGDHPALAAEVARARQATEEFAAWIEARLPKKRGPSGVGIDNYDWYLQHVQLVPYTWRDELALIMRELGRARAFLQLEEQRNAGLPELMPIASEEEHTRRFGQAVTDYMTFLRERDILPLRDYMDGALRARLGRFNPGPREFFAEVDSRDPVVMRTHGYHWFDLAQMQHEPHPSPIRRGPLLYNIFNTRTEGLATGWEEMMLQAGLFDRSPRSRELIYILVAQRAARALGELRLHANQFTLEEAADFAAAHTPRGWLRLSGPLVRAEQHLYLQQPGYGTSYLIGKMQIELLLAERRRQMGDAFTLRRFMEQFEASGLIPVSLISRELTGSADALTR